MTILGGISGFASGLLGIGGGLIIVPALIFALPELGISGAESPKIAMATSLALIVPTAIASAQAHAARGAVDWPMLGLLAPSIIAGAFLSTLLAPKLDGDWVLLLFLTFALVSAWRLLTCAENGRACNLAESKPPHRGATALQGAAGGGIAAVLGIGGAVFIIPILSRFIPMRRAIGTAAALAVPLSIAGSAGYVLADAPSACRQGCVGYVFFPAVSAIGIGAVLAAPLGAWLTHHAPVAVLRRLFALFLICAAGNLGYKTLYPELMSAGTPHIMAIMEDLFREPQPAAMPHYEERGIHRHRPSHQHPATVEPLEPPEPPESDFGFAPPPGESPPPIHLLAAPSEGSMHSGSRISDSEIRPFWS